MSELLVVAIEYAQRGWSVFPIKPFAKVPPYVKWGTEATNDVNQIAEWWNNWPTANIGIATGPSRLIVIDVDTGKAWGDASKSLRLLTKEMGLPLPPTLSSVTASGGAHYFYRRPLRDAKWSSRAGSLRVNGDLVETPGIDIRADGGMVVAPPSVVVDAAYKWMTSWSQEIAPAPEWLSPEPPRRPWKLLERRYKVDGKGWTRRGRGAFRKIEGQIGALGVGVPNNRNSTCFKNAVWALELIRDRHAPRTAANAVYADILARFPDDPAEADRIWESARGRTGI